MARTRYQRDTNSDCTNASSQNKDLEASAGTGQTVSATVAVGMNANVIGFYMNSGDPGSEDLPASSLFRIQLDVNAIGANLSVTVTFHAFNSSCTSLGSATQAESAITTTGLHIVTATWDPPSGADRYGVLIAIDHGGMHGDPSETLTLTCDSDGWFEIPDAPVSFPGTDDEVQPNAYVEPEDPNVMAVAA